MELSVLFFPYYMHNLFCFLSDTCRGRDVGVLIKMEGGGGGGGSKKWEIDENKHADNNSVSQVSIVFVTGKEEGFMVPIPFTATKAISGTI